MSTIAPKKTILVTAPFSEEAARALGDDFDVITIAPSMKGESLATMGLDTELAHCSVIVAELDVVDAATLDKAPHLELIVSCRAKPANVDLEACTARGIPVATTPGRNADVTADLSFALILATVRHVSASERWLRAGNWVDEDVFEPYEMFKGVSLNGRTLGILGGGAVGRRVLARARGFGMTVKVYDPFLPADAFGEEATVAPLDEVMSTSDVVTVHVPLMPETEGLLGARELALMRPDAYLVNAGRAAIINEDALMHTLRTGAIAGAGFDVFYREPLPADHELFSLPNLTLTPHIAGASDDVIAEHSRIAARAIAAWADGSEVSAVANRSALVAHDLT